MLNALFEQINRWRFRMAPGVREKLWRRLNALSRSGVPINAAVEFLSQSKTTGKSASFLSRLTSGLKSNNFSAAAAGWVPDKELLVIHITQENRIEQGFEQAAKIAATQAKLRSTLVSGLTYPLLLAVVSCTVVGVLPGYALDTMLSLSDPKTWPSVSRSVLWLSHFIANWGIAVAAVLATLLIASIWAAPRWSGELRRRFDWYPIFGVYRQISGPEILSAWMALMAAGTQSQRALSSLKEFLPAYLNWHITRMQNAMYQGESIEMALDTGLFDRETLDDLRIFQRTGDFSMHSEEIAQADLDRALARITASTKTLASLLLLSVGAVAVWVYIGIARVSMSFQAGGF